MKLSYRAQHPQDIPKLSCTLVETSQSLINIQPEDVMHLFLLVFFLVAGTLAQAGPQASQIPPCVKSCDPAAIASVNCTSADQYCHCVRQAGILTNITTCADKTCTNPSASLYIFTTLFGEVCAPFNISVPVVGSGDAVNGTNVTFPSPSPSTVMTSGGGKKVVGSEIGWMGNLVVIGVVSSIGYCETNLHA